MLDSGRRVEKRASHFASHGTFCPLLPLVVPLSPIALFVKVLPTVESSSKIIPHRPEKTLIIAIKQCGSRCAHGGVGGGT